MGAAVEFFAFAGDVTEDSNIVVLNAVLLHYFNHDGMRRNGIGKLTTEKKSIVTQNENAE